MRLCWRGRFCHNEPVVCETAIGSTQYIDRHVPIRAFGVQKELDKVRLPICNIDESGFQFENSK